MTTDTVEETKQSFIEPTEQNDPQVANGTGHSSATSRSWKKRMQVNKDLLPMKLMYFFFFAGYSCTLPYLAVFYRYVGMTAQQAGVILGLRPVVQFLASPFWGAVADKFRKHKLVMLLVLLLSSSIVFSTAFFPPSIDKNRDDINMRCCFVCQSNLGISGPQVSAVVSPSIPMVLTPVRRLNVSSLVRAQNGTCSSNHTITTAHPGLSLNTKLSSRQFIVNIQSNLSTCQPVPQGSFAFDIANCETYLSVTFGTKVATKNKCNTTEISQFSICRDEEVHGTHDNSQTFVLLLCLTLLANFFMVFEVGLADATVTKYLIKIGQPRDYGKQRIWGGFGWGIFSILAGLANDKTEETLDVNKYLASFSMYLGLIILTMLCVCKLHTSHLATTERPAIFKNLARVLSNFKIASFLVALLIMGIEMSSIYMYLFLYLEDLGASNLLLGISLAVTTSAEIPLMFVSGFVIKKIGHEGVFYLTFMAFALRFFCYSLLPSAWYVLPVELLHGITFGLCWPAVTSYVGIIAPHGMAATVQGLASGLLFALGAVISGLAGGPIYAKYGAKRMFRGLSLLSVISGILFLLSQKLYMLAMAKHPKQNTELNELDHQREALKGEEDHESNS